MSIPHFFRCPISLDIFTDPVTLSTGQTYDRASIEQWLDSGNLTCPVTMQKLQDTSLVPNHTLRHLIDQWLAGDTKKAPSKPRNSVSVGGTEVSLRTLKQQLQSKHTDNDAKLEILKKLRILSADSDIGKACLIELGFFQVLLHMLFQNPQPFGLDFLEVGLNCILNLSPSTHLDSLKMLKDHSYLASLIQIIDCDNSRIKGSLCQLLETIGSSSETRELCKLLGHQQKVWCVLVSLAKEKTSNFASEAAVRAISGLCSYELNHESAIKHGVVEGLIVYLSNTNRRNSFQALTTLEVLLQNKSGKRALVKNRDAIKVLVKMVFSVSSSYGHKGSEHAVGSLLIVCFDSARIRVEAANAGVLTQLLLLLQSQCSSTAKTKARDLLKLLRSLWVEDSVEKFRTVKY